MLYLKEWRISKGLSQGQLACATGIPQGALSIIERGKRDITVRSLERFAQSLDVDIARLFQAPLADLQLDRHEREEIARAVVEGSELKDPVKNELAFDLRSAISRKLIAFRAPAARMVRTSRWKVSARYSDLQKKYGTQLIHDILGRTEKLLTLYG